ncbi:tRNA (guanosine(37)-N1)-methyltransferase TrmD, partial [bacterium]|nr:tRNA (guanosine(37)-N1)-methyltransferase TrmD [bacterium]
LYAYIFLDFLSTKRHGSPHDARAFEHALEKMRTPERVCAFSLYGAAIFHMPRKKPKITFHIITIFPEAISGYLDESIIARARKGGLIDVRFRNPRDFTKDKHKKIDDRPYGGGPGMVMKAEPIIRAVAKTLRGRNRKKTKIIILSAEGKPFTQTHAITFARRYRDIVLMCGRYEGIDARVRKILRAEEISIGPYILTGGELPAAVILDAVSRHIEGVLGKHESLEEGRVAGPEVYTRPPVIESEGKAYRVPKVLFSGDPKKVQKFREDKTKKRLSTTPKRNSLTKKTG